MTSHMSGTQHNEAWKESGSLCESSKTPKLVTASFAALISSIESETDKQCVSHQMKVISDVKQAFSLYVMRGSE